MARLWRRDLPAYPDTGYRSFLLGLAVLSNIVLTWTVTAGGAAAPLALAHFHMSLTYYSYLLVVSGSIGAMSSYVSSFGDRFGRANLVVIGLLINSVFALVALPEAPNKISYAVLVCVLAFADGAIFVGTPALVRDFSPQMQRGLAMGFWTFGPVAGALVASSVAHAVLPAVATFANWQELFRIAGAVGVVTFVVVAIFLRELSAPLRSQRMAKAQERTLVELKARGLDLQTAMAHRWRQMLKWDLVLSAFAINFFLLIYFTASSYLVFYMTSVMHFSISSFNGMQQLYWGVNVVALVVFGYLSDRLRVRKPFMLLGSVVVIVMLLIFMHLNPGTSFATFAIVLSVMAAFLGCCYCPWFASFTETIESHNPALMATGTSLYGFATRAVLAPFGLVFPLVVSAYNGFIDNAAYLKYV
ncbi:MAG: MFS transporter, partial [Acidimicrobiales bacterium]